MSDDHAIKVENVSKKYCRSLRTSMLYGISDITKNTFGLRSDSDTLRKDEFWAVKDVSFELKRGESLGLIGHNGAGKTTVLKMLNGIFWPDKGRISIKGRVGALIAVGAGFHPMLTGRENIYVNAAVLGMSRQEIDKKLDAIIDFADIGDFLDMSVKNYSSGMYVRLGFAIAVHSDPDILLVDEILAVGDINFQTKCMNKMKELEKRGVTKIFISHNLNSIQLLCQNTLCLSQGQVTHYGETEKVLNEFKKVILSNRKYNVDNVRYGTKEIEIKNVEFIDNHDASKITFKRGEKFTIRIHFEAQKLIEMAEFSVGFWTAEGFELSKATTRDHGIPIRKLSGGGVVNYTIDQLPFNVGKYWISIGCWDSTGHVAYDHHEKMYELAVENGVIGEKIHERFGYVHIPAQWDIRSESVRLK